MGGMVLGIKKDMAGGDRVEVKGEGIMVRAGRNGGWWEYM